MKRRLLPRVISLFGITELSLPSHPPLPLISSLPSTTAVAGRSSLVFAIRPYQTTGSHLELPIKSIRRIKLGQAASITTMPSYTPRGELLHTSAS